MKRSNSLPRGRARLALVVVALAVVACARSPRAVVVESRGDVLPALDVTGWPTTLGAYAHVTDIRGFSEPEAVRYDAEQDVYFVSNFNGDADARDDNGFISRVRPDGTIDVLRFIDGALEGIVLHAPRGMAIVGDTLWVADVDAVRGFDRRTGAALAILDFSGMDVGFLNDVAPGPDGALYITDTGRRRVYRAAQGKITIALADPAMGSPNGITWDSVGGRFVLVPWDGSSAIFGWRPGSARVDTVGRGTGSRYDGVEILAGSAPLVASQVDSSLHLFVGGYGRPFIRLPGRPADIAIDTRRSRVAVPFIALDMVQIWALPR